MNELEQVVASATVSGEPLTSRQVPHPGPERELARKGEGFRERVVHALSQAIANLVVSKPQGERLRFGRVRTPEELAAVGRMRLEVYRVKLPYLLSELSEEGLEEQDYNSFVFALWRGERVVASIRAAGYPYETLRYVPEPELSRWLGEGWNSDYLEWGRLLASTQLDMKRTALALATYAGLYLWGLTPYRKYFGYTRPQVKQFLRYFKLARESYSFTIPHRGEHSYQLLQGDFLKDVVFGLPRWGSSLVGRRWTSVSRALGLARERRVEQVPRP